MPLGLQFLHFTEPGNSNASIQEVSMQPCSPDNEVASRTFMINSGSATSSTLNNQSNQNYSSHLILNTDGGAKNVLFSTAEVLLYFNFFYKKLKGNTFP